MKDTNSVHVNTGNDRIKQWERLKRNIILEVENEKLKAILSIYTI